MAISVNGGSNPTSVKFKKGNNTYDCTEVWFKKGNSAAVKVWPDSISIKLHVGKSYPESTSSTSYLLPYIYDHYQTASGWPTPSSYTNRTTNEFVDYDLEVTIEELNEKGRILYGQIQTRLSSKQPQCYVNKTKLNVPSGGSSSHWDLQWDINSGKWNVVKDGDVFYRDIKLKEIWITADGSKLDIPDVSGSVMQIITE